MWRAVPLLTPVLLEGQASLPFIVNLVLVSVLGLRSLVLLLVRGGLVQSVKGCSRREDGGRLGPWRQAGGRGPLSGRQLEKVESGQSRALH